MIKQAQAFTLIEAIAVVSVVAVLTAILVPCIAIAERSAQVRSSVSRVRQAYVALSLYMQDYDGAPDSYNSYSDYYALALPPDAYWWNTYFGIGESTWRSPCGADNVIFQTGPNRRNGFITYAAPFYQPDAIETANGNRADYADYLSKYRQNSVVILDDFCNEPGTDMRNILTPKRGIAALISGQLVNRIRTGDAFLLQFYSDPVSD